MSEQEPQRHFGIRDLLSAVNLKDFGQMVGAEIQQIGTIVSAAFTSLSRLPFGLVLFLWGMGMALFRSCLLVLVAFTFGIGILAITVSRVMMRLLRGRRQEEPPEERKED